MMFQLIFTERVQKRRHSVALPVVRLAVLAVSVGLGSYAGASVPHNPTLGERAATKYIRMCANDPFSGCFGLTAATLHNGRETHSLFQLLHDRCGVQIGVV